MPQLFADPLSASPYPQDHTDHATESLALPLLWPAMAAIKLGKSSAEWFAKGMKHVSGSQSVQHPALPRFATLNRVRLDLTTMALRTFSSTDDDRGIATVIVAPYAGHSAALVDYAPDQSVVQGLLQAGLPRIYVTDWKSATVEMEDLDVDQYLAELLVAVDEVAGRLGQVNLIGLCEGGWMAAMLAARFPDRVRAIVLAGSPLDTEAGGGPLQTMAEALPMGFYESLVSMGRGRMLGRLMLAGWKSLHPDESYLRQYLQLFGHLDEESYRERSLRFASWYESPLDLPGRWYLHVVGDIIKRNLLARGQFVALGKTLSLSDVHCPAFLLAAEDDDITTPEQAFAAEHLFTTPSDQLRKAVVEGGHIGLFMGHQTTTLYWPEIGRWLHQPFSHPVFLSGASS